MHIFPRARPNELAGDHLLRKSHRCLLLLAITVLISAPLYFWFGAVWAGIRPLGGVVFILVLIVFGLGVAIGPLGVLVFGLMALFLRAESRYAPRLAALSPKDRIAVGIAMVASFLPALAACYPPIQALLTGNAHWQRVVLWFAGAAMLAMLAIAYWYSRRRKLKRQAR